MSKFLLASTPAQGHTNPLLAISSHLVRAGHEVVFYTTRHYQAKVEASGARFVPLIEAADTHDLMVANPQREAAGRRGLRGVKDDLRTIFIDPAMLQYEGLLEILSDFPADVAVADSTFVGLAGLALHPGPHPKLVAVGVLPLTVSSRDTAPFGLGLPPMAGPLGQVRNRFLNWMTSRVALADIQRHANRLLAERGLPKVDRLLTDVMPSLIDAYIQATTPGFEYPRRDLDSSIAFVGHIFPPASTNYEKPAWWNDMDGPRPVVHVTQGTLDNYDLTRLVSPTIAALADDDVLVVATTGGRDPDVLAGPMPANVRIERFIPHDQLLPFVDVMITNGGYGGVHQALANGVPLVIAGDSEDKPEVAARVAWAHVGVNLKTGKPSEKQLALAVRRVLGDPTFAQSARALQGELLAHHALEEITVILERLAAG